MGRYSVARVTLWLMAASVAATLLISCDAWNGGNVGIGQPPPVGPGFGVQQFGTQANDYARAVAVDVSGNVYVACRDNASVVNGSLVGASLVVRKFSAAGSLAWESIGIPAAIVTGIAVGSGGVYATGDTQLLDDGFIAKYDLATGSSIGVFQISGFPGSQVTGVHVTGVALDTLGDVYVGGGANLAGGVQTLFVAKYRWSSGPSPVNVWSNTGFAGAADLLLAGVAMGDAGTLHAAGTTFKSNVSDFDIFVARFSTSTGIQVGQTIRDGGPSLDWAFAVAADAANNTYIAGGTDNVFSGSNAGGSDIIAAKYNAAGNNVWRYQIGSSNDEDALSIALSGTSVYVAGSTFGQFGGQLNKDPGLSTSDVFLIKLPNSSAGPTVTADWVRMYGSIGSLNNVVVDEALGVAVSPNGDVAVVGYTAGGEFEGVNASLGNWDGVLFKVSAAGDLQ